MEIGKYDLADLLILRNQIIQTNIYYFMDRSFGVLCCSKKWCMHVARDAASAYLYESSAQDLLYSQLPSNLKDCKHICRINGLVEM